MPQENYRHVRLYLTEADYKRLKAAAQEADVSLSSYIRQVLAEASVINGSQITERKAGEYGRPPKMRE